MWETEAEKGGALQKDKNIVSYGYNTETGREWIKYTLTRRRLKSKRIFLLESVWRQQGLYIFNARFWERDYLAKGFKNAFRLLGMCPIYPM